ncbi:MAG: hypothetical protein ABJG78_03835 [Cyclobacteriaceae bacterium]
MKLILRIILIAAITYVFSPYFTWWTGMGAAFLICLAMPSTLLNAFVAGFLGVGLVWTGEALVLDVANKSVFTEVIIELLSVPLIDNPLTLVVATGLIGGLSGGFAGTSGASLRHVFKKNKPQGYYS